MIQFYQNQLTQVLKIVCLICLPILLSSFEKVLAQQVDVENIEENLKKENIFKLSGGLRAGLITYAGNSESLRNPYTWNVAGNLNIKLFDLLDVPLSLNLSNANRDLVLPNRPTRISISPKYKAVTTHIGDINLSYSPYTLNGHQFTGLGVDVVPKKSRLMFRAMGGKLQRAFEFDSTNIYAIATYERWGYGGQVSFKEKNYNIALNVFTAKDRANSLIIAPDFIDVRPQQNLVSSLVATLRPFKGLEAKAEVAVSALTSDLRDSSEVAERSSGLYNGFFPVNNSTGYYNAQKFSLNYRLKRNIIGMSYEKVDPEYRTLGAYFFTNDLENITINLGKSLLKNKISLMARGGLQRDNIKNEKAATNRRFVGSFNANYTPSQKLNVTANYSNFSTFMKVNSQFQFINQTNEYQSLDTFEYSQVSQNINLVTNYLLSNKDSTMQFLMFNFSFQDVVAEQFGSEIDDAANLFGNVGLSHIMQLNKVGVDIVSSYYVTSNRLATSSFLTQGPSISIGKQLLKNKLKIRSTFNFNRTSSSIASIKTEDVSNIRFAVVYKVSKKQTISANYTYQNRSSVSNQIGNFSYSFRF